MTNCASLNIRSDALLWRHQLYQVTHLYHCRTTDVFFQCAQFRSLSSSLVLIKRLRAFISLSNVLLSTGSPSYNWLSYEPYFEDALQMYCCHNFTIRTAGYQVWLLFKKKTTTWVDLIQVKVLFLTIIALLQIKAVFWYLFFVFIIICLKNKGLPNTCNAPIYRYITHKHFFYMT